MSDEELIQVISKLDDEHSVEDFSQDISDFEVRPEINDEKEMKHDFFQALVEKI